MNKHLINGKSDVWDCYESVTIPYPGIYLANGKCGYSYISQKCLELGLKKGELLLYAGEGGAKIIDYELLLYRLKLSYNPLEQEYLKNEIAILRQFGRVDTTDYFGEYPPPNEAPDGIVENFIKICNGFYFFKANDQWNFAVCSVISDSELTEIAHVFGRQKTDYLFYDIVTCAIPIYELKKHCTELARFVCSDEALLRVIHCHFLTYVLVCNEPGIEADCVPNCSNNEKSETFLITEQML